MSHAGYRFGHTGASAIPAIALGARLGAANSDGDPPPDAPVGTPP